METCLRSVNHHSESQLRYYYQAMHCRLLKWAKINANLFAVLDYTTQESSKSDWFRLNDFQIVWIWTETKGCQVKLLVCMATWSILHKECKCVCICVSTNVALLISLPIWTRVGGVVLCFCRVSTSVGFRGRPPTGPLLVQICLAEDHGGGPIPE